MWGLKPVTLQFLSQVPKDGVTVAARYEMYKCNICIVCRNVLPTFSSDNWTENARCYFLVHHIHELNQHLKNR